MGTPTSEEVLAASSSSHAVFALKEGGTFLASSGYGKIIQGHDHETYNPFTEVVGRTMRAWPTGAVATRGEAQMSSELSSSSA